MADPLSAWDSVQKLLAHGCLGIAADTGICADKFFNLDGISASLMSNRDYSKGDKYVGDQEIQLEHFLTSLDLGN